MSFSVSGAVASAVNFITSAAQAASAKITGSNQATSPAKPDSTGTTNSMNGPKTEPTKFFSAFGANKQSGPQANYDTVLDKLSSLNLKSSFQLPYEKDKKTATAEFNRDFANLSSADKEKMANRGDPTLLVKHLSFENKISLFLLTGQILKAPKQD